MAVRVVWCLAVAPIGASAQTDHRERGQPVRLTVSAASSLTDAFETIAYRFTMRHPNITVRLNFGGSNHLQRQIEAAGGQGIDVFASAGAAPMDALIDAGLVRTADRRTFAGNRIALICPSNNPAAITAFADLAETRVHRIAIGASNVPVGRYGRQILRHLDLLDGVRPKFVENIHVRQAADYVARGEVDAGLVYATDAAELIDRVETVAIAEPEWHEPIRYPIAILRTSHNRRAARLFMDFVTSLDAQAVLADHGFQPPPVDVAMRQPAPADAEPDSPYAHAWTAMKLSLIAATCAMVIVFPLGTALGALLARRAFPGRELIDAVFTLPMILPPTVVGYYLIILLGARSPVGQSLESWFDVRVALTLLGATIASAVIALPLMVKSARAAFQSVNREFELASYALGKGKFETLFRVTLPLARNGLMAGVILSFARALGEFGATFMLAGIIPGQTMTMPVAIFHAFTNHDDATARVLVMILTVFSVLVIYVTNRLNAKQMQRIGSRG